MRHLVNYGIDMKVAEAYAESLENHLKYLREAGEQLGVSKEQLNAHDSSKWSYQEFPHYANWFHGEKTPEHAAAFERAWLHHLHHNPHHWQHWIFPDSFKVKGTTSEEGVVEMPKKFVLEMVADWMGSSRAYTGSWNMTDWLRSNLPRIKLHKETRKYLATILNDNLYHVYEGDGFLRLYFPEDMTLGEAFVYSPAMQKKGLSL